MLPHSREHNKLSEWGAKNICSMDSLIKSVHAICKWSQSELQQQGRVQGGHMGWHQSH